MKRSVRLVSFIAFFSISLLVSSVSLAVAACGTIAQDVPSKKCLIGTTYNASYTACSNDTVGSSCCVGGNAAAECQALVGGATATPRPPTPTGAHPPSGTPAPSGPIANPLQPPTDQFFNLVDPLQHGGGQTVLDNVPSAYANELKTPGGIVNRLLVFAFPLAGLILFLMLVWAGFEMMIGAPTKKSMDAGKQRATAALVGFLLLFAAYWIFQIVEVVFGVRIL